MAELNLAAFLERARYFLALGMAVGVIVPPGAEVSVELAGVLDATADHEALRRVGAKLSDAEVIRLVRAHADAELRAELEEHLAAEGRDGLTRPALDRQA